MKTTVHLVDYGLGNLHSVRKAVEHLGGSVVVTENGAALADARRIIVPGVGAFADGMAGLRERGFLAAIPAALAEGAQLMGICLGAQLLLSESHEFGRHAGLGLIPGKVAQLSGAGLRVPHVGWSRLEPVSPGAWHATPLAKFPAGGHAYFVHSYQMVPEDPAHLIAFTRAGNHAITAVLRRDRIWGVQFHPEKSGRDGLYVLHSFLYD